MRRWLSSLQCLEKWHCVLGRCLNQCLSYAGRQLHCLFRRIWLNQKTSEGWLSSQINAFFEILNFYRQDIPCHAVNSVAGNGHDFNFDHYRRRCPSHGGHSVARGLVPQSVVRGLVPRPVVRVFIPQSVARGLVPQSVARVFIPRVKPRINLGAMVMPLTMLGRSILGHWAPRKDVIAHIPSRLTG